MEKFQALINFSYEQEIIEGNSFSKDKEKTF